jgi:hypothetical protein
MTASDILNLAATVATVQIICDLVANWRVYSKEPYERALGALSRTKTKLEREKVAVAKELQKPAEVVKATTKKKSGSKADKLTARLKRAEDDHADALALVARKHTVPGVFTSLVFVILLRILGAEHKGKIIGILPFAPFPLLQRLTARGLEFGPLMFEPDTDKVTGTSQACVFMFIYFLCGFSVKFYAGKLFGKKPPPGAESIMSLMNSPAGEKMMRSMGVDPNDLKME